MTCHWRLDQLVDFFTFVMAVRQVSLLEKTLPIIIQMTLSDYGLFKLVSVEMHEGKEISG